MKPRPDALAKLLEHCDWLASFQPTQDATDRENAKTRRLVNALLRSAVEEAVAAGYKAGWCSRAVMGGRQTLNEKAAVVAAILRRPTGRARGRAGR